MGLQNLLEDYRNWVKTQEWKNKKQDERLFGGDPVLQEEFEKWGGGFSPSNLGGGLSGLAGAIKASHGSPHAHTKFDFSKIGTGEGAQAYGHGGYFAQGFDSPVAKEYAKANMGRAAASEGLIDSLPTPIQMEVFKVMQMKPGPFTDEAINDVIKRHPQTKEIFSAKQPNLYNVELKWPDAAREAADPLGEHHLLDWDATLENQPEAIKSAISKLEAPGTSFSYGDLLEMLQAAPHLRDPKEYAWAHPTGQDVYNALGESRMVGNKAPGQVEASNYLRDMGIPGIRYLDEGSRGYSEVFNVGAPVDDFGPYTPYYTQAAADEALKELQKYFPNAEIRKHSNPQTRNYVMFDDRFSNIVSRNGVSLTDLLRK